MTEPVKCKTANEKIAKILGFKKEKIPGFGWCWRYPEKYREYQYCEPTTNIPDFTSIISQGLHTGHSRIPIEVMEVK